MATRRDSYSPRSHDSRLIDVALRRVQSTLLAAPSIVPVAVVSGTGAGVDATGRPYTVHQFLHDFDRHDDPAASQNI